ncbi:MAG: GGDEF domain-containing protein [Candidatus Eisenbacteria bacterium]|uniref:GGDEF domain-containing protein n=1 Tax=Eiseniibacteriota bacterium TaxID=2212470 RepID=A0A538UC24_UNCEI|nr:MAG: GGDEF domain-containing protein [Candidatus Eisenbacteria bacterium]
MKREDIGFRELLERVLPLQELPPAERLQVQRALNSGIESELERAAYLTIETLEGSGALRRLPPPGNGGGAIRFQPRDAFQIITLHLPGRVADDGVTAYPRSALPARAVAHLDQLRPLLRFDDPVLVGDPREGSGRAGLIGRLEVAGRDLLGESAVAFHPSSEAPERPEAAPALDAALAAEAIARPAAILYCADAWGSRRLEAEARRRGLRSLVVAGVVSSEGVPLGHLEVSSPRPAAYRPDDLARVGLLADYCGSVVERAARIEKLVFVDPLTKVYNRSYFDLQAKNELARAQRDQGSVALCIADIDDFKAFNTAFGYEAGNRVLVDVAHALRSGVRPFDTVARWGGEEFAVLLTTPVHADDARAVSERLRVAVERTPLELEGLDRQTHRVTVTVSIGVALFPDHAQNAQDLWSAANRALLAAKADSKNRVVFGDGREPRA